VKSFGSLKSALLKLKGKKAREKILIEKKVLRIDSYSLKKKQVNKF